jgi:hypothetical protein
MARSEEEFGGYGSEGERRGDEPVAEATESCAPLGGRRALLERAVAEASVDGAVQGPDNHSRLAEGKVDVLFECAVADALPAPEDFWPSMRAWFDDRERPVFIRALCAWNHSCYELEVFALRRMPPRPFSQYPVVAKVRAVPAAPWF